MSSTPPLFGRRAFIRNSLALGVGAAVGLPSSPAGTPPGAAGAPLPVGLGAVPSRVFVQEGEGLVGAARQGDRFTSSAVAVEFSGGEVVVSCPKGELSRVVLRWALRWPSDIVFMGDHWERSYGDLQWRPMEPERVMPWYFAASSLSAGGAFMAGVGTQPAAFCFWTADAEGLSLWLDFRNGGSACIPGDREIRAARIHTARSQEGESAAAALRRFCGVLCPKPRLPAAPVCGNNNWYYAYGRDFDDRAMIRDASFLAELAAGHPNRPYCVIDAGWTPGSSCPGGPWKQGDAKRFGDMPRLAADMRALGVRPGIWMRPTALTTVDDPRRIRRGPVTVDEKPLDLTMADNLDLIRQDVARVRGWGYDLIKHDFSTYDAFGRWGFEMGAELTDSGWHLADRSRTNAEVLLALYQTLRSAAGDAVLLGCNTVGHLGAGLFEVQRIGDDTSGQQWERTRRMGVNTLAYRLAQNGTFFVCDADCAAHTSATPWEWDSQYLDLVARSGTALFISADPRTVTAAQKAAFGAAVRTALSGGEKGGCEPLDWMETTAPRSWRIGGATAAFSWEQPFGAWPFRV